MHFYFFNIRIRFNICRMRFFKLRMRPSNSRIRHKLSIKLLICIKSYAQSVFDIVRPFDILAVECDLKRSHIAFDTNQLTPFLPNPVTFLQVEFSRIRGRIRSYSTFSHICRIRSNPMWDPGLIDDMKKIMMMGMMTTLIFTFLIMKSNQRKKSFQ